jgi:hypothetical protein
MVDTSDAQTILNAAINVVQSINALGQVYLSVQGAKNMANITTATVVLPAPGRIAAISVTTAGNATGVIYDSASLTNLTRPIYTIGNATGIQVVNLPLSYGILAVPGGNMTLTVSYSPIVTPI